MQCVVENLATRYEQEGQGSCVLLIHGWGDSLSTFDKIVPLLAKEMSVVRLDLPGFGQTEQPATAWGVEEYTAFIVAFIAKKNLHPTVIVGHSFGGGLAAFMVARGLVSVRGLVLVGAAGLRRPKKMSTRFVRFWLSVASKSVQLAEILPPIKTFMSSRKSAFYQRIGSEYHYQAGLMRKIFANVVSCDLRHEISKLHIPVLLLWGGADAQTPIFEAREWERLIPQSVLETWSDGTHFVHQEHPDAVADSIRSFVDQNA